MMQTAFRSRGDRLKRTLTLKLLVLASMAASGVSSCIGQVAGNSAYARGQGDPSEFLRQARTNENLPVSSTSVFVDAGVLVNVPADAFVVSLGVSEEGSTLGEARQKVGAKIGELRGALSKINHSGADIFSDFVAQNRIYGMDVSGTVATEKVVGFELKENVSVRCGSEEDVDRVIASAADAGVFDLIKVDYVVSNIDAVRVRALEEASKVVWKKVADYQRLLGVSLRSSPQLYADRSSSFYPTDMYASYQAAEAENVSPGYSLQNYVVHGARKMRTFYYNALNAKGFDHVVNPVVTRPVVQFALYLKLRFELVGATGAVSTGKKH